MLFIRPQSSNQMHINASRSIALLCGFILSLGYISGGYGQQNDDHSLIDIRNTQFEDSYETLLVGESELLIIVKQSTTPISRGVAILFTDYGSNPLSEHGLGHLSTYLNDVGWVTIAIQAPNEGFLPTDSAEAEQSSADSQAPDNMQAVHANQGLSLIHQDAFERHEVILKLQMQALQAKAKDYPGFFLVVAQGTTAAWLTKIFAEKQIDLPDAFVSVSPHWPEYQYNQLLPSWVAQTEMPYLDIYTNADNDWAASTVSNRKVLAEKSLKMMYRQRKLLGQSLHNVQHRLLGKEIYGWLSYMGW